MLKVALVTGITYNEPLGLISLIAFLKRFGADLGLRIAFFDINYKGFESDIAAFSPSVIGYSVVTGEHIRFKSINEKLKSNMSFLSVFGGPHATYFPDFIRNDFVDAIVRGEGETAFLNLLRNINNNEISDPYINNCWIKTATQKIIKNDLSQNLQNISKLPFDDRKEIYEKSALLRMGGFKTFIASRGCPYNCTYCYNYKNNQMYNNKFYRVMEPKRIVDEISLIKSSYPMTFIQFSDDIFGMKNEWLKEFSSFYKKHIDVPFHCSVRPDLITEEKVLNFKKANCLSVSMAIEHGDYNYRKEMLNRDITDEQIIDTVKLFKLHGIKVACQIIIGLPNTDLKGDLQTVQLCIKANLDNVIVHIFQPYPGTKLGDSCIGKCDFISNYHDLRSNKSDISLGKGKRKYLEKIHDYFPFLVSSKILRNRRLVNGLMKFPKIPFSRLLYFIYKYFMYKQTVPIAEPFSLKIMRVISVLRLGNFGRLFS